MPVPLSTYGSQGAIKYWDEFARQYLAGYGITLRRACTVVYVPYLWYCQVLGVRQYLEATVQHYVVPVPSSMYRTYGTAKYLEYDSTLVEVRVPWSMPQLRVMSNTTLNVPFCAWHLRPLLLVPFH